LGIVGVNPAQAASLNNGTGISNPTNTITFSEIPLANGTPLTNQYSGLGVTFSGLYANLFAAGANINPPAATNYSGFGSTSPFLIGFTQPQSEAAFRLATANPLTATFEALRNNSVVGTFSAPASLSNTNNFYGFTGVTFDAIRVTTVASSFDVTIIDNIQFGSATAQSVPEPFSIIGTLVGGTAAFRIRKKLVDANKV
jgi:hypothetical protein